MKCWKGGRGSGRSRSPAPQKPFFFGNNHMPRSDRLFPLACGEAGAKNRKVGKKRGRGNIAPIPISLPSLSRGTEPGASRSLWILPNPSFFFFFPFPKYLKIQFIDQNPKNSFTPSGILGAPRFLLLSGLSIKSALIRIVLLICQTPSSSPNANPGFSRTFP